MRLCVCVTSKYLAVDYDGFCVCVCVCKSDTFFIFLSVKRGDIPCLALICFSRSLAISYILFLWPSRAHCLLEGDEGNRS